MFRITRDGHKRSKCRMFHNRNAHRLERFQFQSMRAILACEMHFGALSCVRSTYGADFVGFLALSLTPCFYCGRTRHTRPGKAGTLYVTSLHPFLGADIRIRQVSNNSSATTTGSQQQSTQHSRALSRFHSCHSPIIPHIVARGVATSVTILHLSPRRSQELRPLLSISTCCFFEMEDGSGPSASIFTPVNTTPAPRYMSWCRLSTRSAQRILVVKHCIVISSSRNVRDQWRGELLGGGKENESRHGRDRARHRARTMDKTWWWRSPRGSGAGGAAAGFWRSP